MYPKSNVHLIWMFPASKTDPENHVKNILYNMDIFLPKMHCGRMTVLAGTSNWNIPLDLCFSPLVSSYSDNEKIARI